MVGRQGGREGGREGGRVTRKIFPPHHYGGRTGQGLTDGVLNMAMDFLKIVTIDDETGH